MRIPVIAPVLGLMALLLGSCSEPAVEPLPQLGASRSQTSVSGISSGAYMAGQFQMAHARDVVGAAIIAGGPYGCAESAFTSFVTDRTATMLNASKAVSGCMLNAMILMGVPNPPALAERARLLARSGAIDPIDHVIQDRVYVFSGTNDRTVVPGIVASAVDYYRALGLSSEHIKFVSDIAAGHAFVTESAGGSCEVSAKPYVVDCDYDQAGDLLQHIHGPLERPATALSGAYLVFDQRPFTRDLDGAGLAPEGALYVPRACRSEQCRVHITFHGCAQSREAVGNAFIEGSGLARWADTNRIIVLFPQIGTGTKGNPQGCWDWWGYTGRAFLTTDAPQIKAVRRMLDQLSDANPAPGMTPS